MSSKKIPSKPQSRFIEHFDMMTPNKLLNTIIAEEKEQHDSRNSDTCKQAKKPTPLYALSQGSFSSAERPVLYSLASPTSPTPPALLETRLSHDISNTTITGPIMDTVKITGNRSSLTKTQKEHDEHHQGTTPASIKLRSLNRADIIIKRYESWNKLIILIQSWINEISRLSIQSEKSYKTLLQNDRFSNLKGNSVEAANSIHAAMHGFTMDLASQEHKFGRLLQDEQLPVLEKFKKECHIIIKSLKNRLDLGLEEFLKRAELTASLISQLNKTCKEARRTIEKGSQVINDPWLVNLYLLRQLKKEVDEENRLRKLMIPIQQEMQEFETRLLKAVENALKVCFNKPGVLNDDQLGFIQSYLNQVTTNNWDEFVAMNKKDIVNENQPLKHYLHINYACKNDPLVMTIRKGQLERRSGVLNKYSTRFFVLTASGFLHQFKLNDKISPEQSLYLPRSTVSQLKDDQSNAFEIQRSGSVLQRDKSYVFRAFSPEEIGIWCKLISDIAASTPPPIQQISTASLSIVSQRISFENTPPLSPISVHEHRRSMSDTLCDSLPMKSKVYSPQLNID